MDAPLQRNLPIGPGRFDAVRGELSLGGRTARLRPRTAACLAYLVQHADRVVGKDELLAAVWPDAVVTEDSLVQCVKEIRHALGPAGRDCIRTHPRQGYSFAADSVGVQLSGPGDARAPAAPIAWRMPLLTGALLVALTVSLGLLDLYAAQWARGAGPVSLVVLPVTNLTGDRARENAADEITEALTAMASHMHRVEVIGPSTAFAFKGKPVDVRLVGAELRVRYALQGALRLHAGQALVALRLTATDSGVLLWSADFPLQADGLPELREDALEGVASALGEELVSAEARRSGLRSASVAADALSRARALMRWSGSGSTGIGEARELLEQVVRIEPDLPLAWALLATTHLHEVRFSRAREQHLARAAEAVQRALQLHPDSDGARLIQGRVLYEQGRMPEALRAFDRALAANPSNARALAWRGAALVMLGRPQEAREPIAQAMRLSPRDAWMSTWLLFAGVARLHLGDDAEAVAWLARAVEAEPESAFARLFYAGALGAAGDVAQAREQMAQLRRLRPDLTLTRFRAAEPSRQPDFLQQRERLYAGLRRAGIPE